MEKILTVDDWVFRIDYEKTAEYARHVSLEHCTCSYCENYYRTVRMVYPELEGFLAQFALQIEGPSELFPIEPTLYLSGYRVTGEILHYGQAPMMAGAAPVCAEPSHSGTFLIEAGELQLPWVLDEDMDEVISPANEPEFLEKMYAKLQLRSSGFGTVFPLC